MYSPISLSLSLVNILIALTALPFLYLLITAIYNIFFHPLRHFPGPWYAHVSILWWQYHCCRGNIPYIVQELHERYGEVLRIAPDELSFIHSQAWKDIYGHHPGKPENGKDPSHVVKDQGAHPDVAAADLERHSYLRKLLFRSFSDKSLKEQEPMILRYIDLLVRRLQQECEGGRKVDMVQWFNFTTFDIAGHFTFGEPFDCLEKSYYHPWIRVILVMTREVTVLRALNRFRAGFSNFLIELLPPAKRGIEDHLRMTAEKLRRRKEKAPPYTDFLTYLIEAEESGGLHFADLAASSSLLIGAGSETTAALLSGATWYLLTNPHVLATLQHEVRTAFPSSSSSADITLQAVSQLRYMGAFLNESLRMYPPIPGSLPRRSPPEGAVVNGQFIPGNTVLSIYQLPAYRSKANFRHPDRFAPERWLDDGAGEYADDNRDVMQPFSYGPRNCIGQNFAYAEMRLVMAKLLWHFDMELLPQSAEWRKQKIYIVWKRPPLWVRLTPVVRGGGKATVL